MTQEPKPEFSESVGQEPKPEAPKPPRNFFYRAGYFITLAVGLILGSFITKDRLSELAVYWQQFLIAFFFVFLLLFGLVLLLLFQRKWILRKLLGVEEADLKEVKATIEELAVNVSSKDLPAAGNNLRHLAGTGIAWYSEISFRRWVVILLQTLFVGFGGLIGTVLLFNQNQLIQGQSELIDQQNQLQEADRRSALVFLMSNILEKIDQETSQLDSSGQKVDTLTDGLIGRIAALAQGLRPYRFLEDGKLTEKAYSPERGQLLISLVNQGLDTATLKKIFQRASFRNAYLSEANFSGGYLEGVNLEEVNLERADLRGAKLEGASLYGADLEGADLREAKLTGANLFLANLRGADLTGADLTGAYLFLATLSGADLSGTDLTGADLTGAYLLKAKGLSFESLKDCEFLYGCQLDPKLKAELKKKKPSLFEDPDKE